MSPEHDDKLFGHELFSFQNPNVKQYLQAWSTVPAPCWNGTPMFPETLSHDELIEANSEFKAIPEMFYITLKHLPVITPSCFPQFCEALRKSFGDKIPRIALWTWCSGSSRLALLMLSAPFDQLVLFPVDLRYGWDLRLPEHQRLLTTADTRFRPLVTTYEPRCKYWSRMGSSRDPEVTAERRGNETGMLKFLLQHSCNAAQDDRHGLFENPKSSAIWNKSPLASLQYHEKFSNNSHTTDMCRFSTLPDGHRHRKETKIMSTFKLIKAVAKCRCKHGHEHLERYDPEHRATSETDSSIGSTFKEVLSKCLPRHSYAFEDDLIKTTPDISNSRRR